MPEHRQIMFVFASKWVFHSVQYTWLYHKLCSIATSCQIICPSIFVCLFYILPCFMPRSLLCTFMNVGSIGRLLWKEPRFITIVTYFGWYSFSLINFFKTARNGAAASSRDSQPNKWEKLFPIKTQFFKCYDTAVNRVLWKLRRETLIHFSINEYLNSINFLCDVNKKRAVESSRVLAWTTMWIMMPFTEMAKIKMNEDTGRGAENKSLISDILNLGWV